MEQAKMALMKDFQLTGANYGSRRGELLLHDSELSEVKRRLPQGVYLVLMDDTPATKSASSRAPKAKARSATRGKIPLRSPKIMPRKVLPSDAAANRRRSERERTPAAKLQPKPDVKKAAPKKVAAAGRGKAKRKSEEERPSKIVTEQDDSEDLDAILEEESEAPQEEDEEAPRRSSVGGRRPAPERRPSKVAAASKAEKRNKEGATRSVKGRKASASTRQDEKGPQDEKRPRTASELKAAEPSQAPVPEAPARVVHQLLTGQEKAELQEKIDALSDDQLDRVIEFLQPDLGNGDSDDVSLDLDTLPAERQRALIKIVDEERARAAGAAGQGMKSPNLPTVDPGATPRPGEGSVPATPRSEQAAAPPSRNGGEVGLEASQAKRQHAWEVCVAREVQRQSQLREVREAASGSNSTPGATPVGGDPVPAEPPSGMPELTLPPAASGPEAPAQQGSLEASAADASQAPAPRQEQQEAEAAAESAPSGTGDSMLDSCKDVLAMVNDFATWM
eukprot:TRINITY_DN61281_c0_g1_i1.p1 TRINITY_DN61281_c0_g1~~TRINITY_DN61281_c0_g1_i1.p1  ORF type:complete len:554 (+),score=142.50 TRINITY_DN61281_c0_g1_i1:144-1664(+)